MNHKTRTGLAAILVAGAMFAPFTVSASHMSREDWKQQRTQMRCKSLEMREGWAWHSLSRGGAHAAGRLQEIINRQNNLSCPMPSNIVEVVLDNPNFSTLVTAVGAADLVTLLQSSGPFTLFAPTNAAFAKLPAGTVEALLADKTALENILKYHVVAGSVPAETAVTLTSATMANGGTVDIELRHGELFINDSKVIVNNVKTANGIVHVIDTVLIP